ncbi:MAG TPA: hypothetical protein P5096_02190 [Patescibacteria group bacterium]|nr:hypothetical protein [Patescibacteria group bacterium]
MNTNELEKQKNVPEKPVIVVENIEVLKRLANMNLKGLEEKNLMGSDEYRKMQQFLEDIKNLPSSAKVPRELLSKYKVIIDNIQVLTRAAKYEVFKSSKTAMGGIIGKKK